MRKSVVNKRVQRLKEHGYNPIHIIGDLYLVRNFSRRAKSFSLYGFMLLRDR